MTLNEFLGRLDKVRKTGQNQYVACCPGHDDKNPSLCISSSEDKILLHCQRGCDTAHILSSMGLEMRDLFYPPPTDMGYNRRMAGEKGRKRQAVREYAKTDALLAQGATSKSRENGGSPKVVKDTRYHEYRGEDNRIIARKCITTFKDSNKGVSWERYENGSYTPGLQSLKPPLYRLYELINSTETVYVVEGEKDCDTLAAMGRIATTSPKGAAGRWDENYIRYLRARDVVIISDNDKPGQNYASNIIEALKGEAHSLRHIPAKQIFPHLKNKGDISDIVDVLGREKTAELLDEQIRKTPPINSQRLPDYFYYNKSGQLAIDRPRLADYIRKNERYLFELGENNEPERRLWYRDGVYQSVSADEIRGIIKGYITSRNPAALQMSDVEEVYRNIITDSVFVRPEKLDCDENIINFKNGILHLDTLELTPHSPDIYSTIQIDCEWQGRAQPTPTFDRFLCELCGDDSGKMQFLMEFMGVALSNVMGHRMKSALFMVGEGNTGKSQLKSLCERILGQRNCSAVDLNTLERRFGTSSIYGKRLSGSSDLSYMSVNELKIFKQVTGGDSIFAERKGQSPFYFRYNGILWFCMNRLPKFGGDRGDWVYDRINIVECNNVIPPERRDRFLCDRMYAERVGIVYKCVHALLEVIKRGYSFVQTTDIAAKRIVYSRSNNPIAAFYEQCCEDNDKNAKCLTVTAMHRVFMRWCKDNESGFKCSLSEFKEEVSKLLDTPYESLITRSNKGFHFNFSLNQEAVNEYCFENKGAV